MPASKPSTLPLWADTGDITVPSSGKQHTGWVSGEAPPHDYFNWWQNLQYQWSAYLKDYENNAHTWTEPQVGLVIAPALNYTALHSDCDYQAGYPKACIWSDANGAIHLEGTVKVNSPTTDEINVWPAGTLTGLNMDAAARVGFPVMCFEDNFPPGDLNASFVGQLSICGDGSVKLGPTQTGDPGDVGTFTNFGGSIYGAQFSIVYNPNIAKAT